MEKVLTEYVCDFCGVKCEREDYVLPIIESETLPVKNGKGQEINRIYNQKIVSKQTDMCPSCKIKVARLVSLAHYVDIQAFEDNIYEKVKETSSN